MYTGSIPVGASRDLATSVFRRIAATVAGTMARRRIGVVPSLVLLGIALLALGLAAWNPFGTEEVDRSPPAVLKSLDRLSEYRAATANIQQIVDVEKDTALPSFLAGERTVLVAAGTVDAAVDFSGLGGESLEVNGKSVTITLPAAALTPARLDLEQTRVVDTDKGLGNRIGDLFSDDADSERKLLLAAQEKLEEAARNDPSILRAAERNTRLMLEGMMRGLGFETVTVRFEPAPA